MYIETERLIIREFSLADLDARRALTLDAFGVDIPDDEGREFLQWAELNHKVLGSLYQPPYGDRAIVLKERGDLIGSVGLVPAVIPWGVLPNYQAQGEPPSYLVQPEFGLFWAIFKTHQRKGYASEAGQAIINFAFNRLYARRIVAQTEYDNLASQGVMKKLGMTLERNPGDKPHWLQVVGVLENPAGK